MGTVRKLDRPDAFVEGEAVCGLVPRDLLHQLVLLKLPLLQLPRVVCVTHFSGLQAPRFFILCSDLSIQNRPSGSSF
jgi:hypothetical protein